MSYVRFDSVIGKRVQHIDDANLVGAVVGGYIEPAPVGYRPQAMLIVRREGPKPVDGMLLTWPVDAARMVEV
jgi:hypothetical protein